MNDDDVNVDEKKKQEKKCNSWGWENANPFQILSCWKISFQRENANLYNTFP